MRQAQQSRETEVRRLYLEGLGLLSGLKPQAQGTVRLLAFTSTNMVVVDETKPEEVWKIRHPVLPTQTTSVGGEMDILQMMRGLPRKDYLVPSPLAQAENPDGITMTNIGITDSNLVLGDEALKHMGRIAGIFAADLLTKMGALHPSLTPDHMQLDGRTNRVSFFGLSRLQQVKNAAAAMFVQPLEDRRLAEHFCPALRRTFTKLTGVQVPFHQILAAVHHIVLPHAGEVKERCWANCKRWQRRELA